MAHDHLIEMLDLDAEVLQDYYADLIGWVGGEAPVAPRIADLGAGSGTGSLALARALPDATITAVDVSPEMLAHLRRRAREAGLADRISTLEADLDGAWPDLGPVDVVWASASMHHLADPAAALSSAYAALAPGGLLVIAELDSLPTFLTGTPEESVEEWARALMADLRHEAGMHMHEDWGDLARTAGFGEVTARHFDIALDPPLTRAAGRYAEVVLGRTRHGLADRLDAADVTALDDVIGSLPDRGDLRIRTERTVWLSRK
jgi:SAM-dependent methyltransferase